MPLCERCTLLTIEELVDQDILFHRDLGTLKSSAERGCELCTLCWKALEKSVIPAHLESLLRGESVWPNADTWTPTMWLRGHHFFDHGVSGAEIWVGCGKSPPQVDKYSNPSPSVDARLEVYELPGCPSKYRLHGRRYTATKDCLPRIQAWLDNCHTNHRQCEAGRSGAMPTRIIDVGDPTGGAAVRLLSTRGMHEQYIALSYCWGVAGSDIFTLNAKTHDSMRNAIAEPDLAKTHREVIWLARALGIRYVWVDALCIIQGDAEDWERESKTMALVYGNATLTVIAGRSADSRKGFVENNLASKGHPPPCILLVDKSEKPDTLSIGLGRKTDVGPVSTRAWCFQERLGSRRSVIFAEEQLLFECGAGVFQESGKRTPNIGRPKFISPSPVIVAPPDETEARRDQAVREWYEILTRFSRCRLTDPHDIFAAIASIAQSASNVIKSRYLAGLWECDIARGLLWRPSYHFQVGADSKIPATRPKATKLTTGSGPVVRAPSWSWAAVEGPVAQETATPRMIERYKDPKYRKVWPQHVNPERWTLDDGCGVGTLHMPSCQLQLMGHVAQAAVSRKPVSEYLSSRPSWRKVSRFRVQEHGFLLAGRGIRWGGAEHDRELDQIVAIGFFDVAEERHGVDVVWCLLIVPHRGLMLKKNTDGGYSRIGWFMPEDDGWLIEREPVDVRLY